jgi:hypothetical protein
MFGKRAREDAERIRELRGEKAILLDRLSQLKNTRIRYSVMVNLGLTPVYDIDLESAIMADRFAGNQGHPMPAGTLEIVSQYTPLLGTDEPDEDEE